MFSLYFSQVLIRSRILRENGKYIPKQVRGSLFPLLCEFEHFLFLISQTDNFGENVFLFKSFLMRKFYFNNQEDGFFKKTKRKVVPPSPMTGTI